MNNDNKQHVARRGIRWEVIISLLLLYMYIIMFNGDSRLAIVALSHWVIRNSIIYNNKDVNNNNNTTSSTYDDENIIKNRVLQIY